VNSVRFVSPWFVMSANSLTDRGFCPIIGSRIQHIRLMTEPQRTDSARTASPDAERATRIEELLVSGLDHYFAEDYEQAINVWTRVIFLDRDHDRARAYIDRARKAIAERQRESEELLHRGLDAYKTGDVESARDLLTRAVDQGAPSDEALVLLDRMDRLEGTGFDAPLHRRMIPARRQAEQAASGERGRKWQWAVGALVLTGIGAAVYYGAAPALSWLVDVPATNATAQAAPAPLPIVRTADILLDRARELYTGGHLHDALRLLDRIGIADPLRPDADRLRGDIQRALLAAASAGPSRDTVTRQ
jgi:tetratricopeptide (TPR) repeat protein